MIKFLFPYFRFFLYRFRKKGGLWYFFIITITILLFIYSFIYRMINSDFLMGGMFYIFDIMSFLLFILSIWIRILLLLSSVSIRFRGGYLYFCLLSLIRLILLIMVFFIDNIIFFYIFFELCSLPTLFFIIRFGYQPERWRAGVYLILYTFFGSIPFFIRIIWIIMKGIINLRFRRSYYFYGDRIIVLFFFIGCRLAFIVKLPIFGFHIWLPKAHVEAPIAGSILLAGLLLKLGGYGFIRFFIFFRKFIVYRGYYFRLGFLGGLFACLITFRQRDLKCFIAYSSVCHIRLILGCLFSYNFLGVIGSLMMIFGHGFVSCGIFCLARLYYDRFRTRNMFILGGVRSFLVGGLLYWFLLLGLNIGLPPFFNFWREMRIFIRSISWWGLDVWLIVIISFQMAGVINLFYFIGVRHGDNFIEKLSYDFDVREKSLIIILRYPSLILFFIVYFFI